MLLNAFLATMFEKIIKGKVPLDLIVCGGVSISGAVCWVGMGIRESGAANTMSVDEARVLLPSTGIASETWGRASATRL